MARSKSIGLTRTLAAKHFGVSYDTFNEWLSKGWAETYRDGSINVEETAKLVAKFRDPTQGGRRAYNKKGSTPDSPDLLSPPSTPIATQSSSNKRNSTVNMDDHPSSLHGSEDDHAQNALSTPKNDLSSLRDDLEVPVDVSFGEAKRRREYWNSLIAEMEAKKLSGELISIADAKRTYTTVVSSAVANLDTLPARITPLVVGLTDTRIIREIIRKELASALRGISAEQPPVIESND